ncbi:hypothetical protein, partial [Clostridium tarantellae]|uniref:hypothetical protein n=1 Tax=Clostridium tarantellae TaxID=39493 RepID=UPI001A9B313E
MSLLLDDKNNKYSNFLKFSLIVYISLNFLSIFSFYIGKIFGGEIFYIISYLPVLIIGLKIIIQSFFS